MSHAGNGRRTSRLVVGSALWDRFRVQNGVVSKPYVSQGAISAQVVDTGPVLDKIVRKTNRLQSLEVTGVMRPSNNLDLIFRQIQGLESMIRSSNEVLKTNSDCLFCNVILMGLVSCFVPGKMRQT